VHFDELAIPREFIGKNYDQDPAYRQAFQHWINQRWLEKDERLAQLHAKRP
jgi:hypothetical protein